MSNHDRRTPSTEHGPEPRRTPPRGRSPVHPNGPKVIPTKDGTLEFEYEDVDPGGYREQQGLRDHRDPRDLEEITLKSMRMEVSTFNGCLDPNFLDWIRGMDQYFD